MYCKEINVRSNLVAGYIAYGGKKTKDLSKMHLKMIAFYAHLKNTSPREKLKIHIDNIALSTIF